MSDQHGARRQCRSASDGGGFRARAEGVALAGIVLVAAVGAAVWLLGRSADTRERPFGAPGGTGSETGSFAEYGYQYVDRSLADLRVFPGSVAAREHAVSTSIAGVVRRTVVQADAAGVVVAYAFRSPEVELTVDGDGITGQARDIAAGLRRAAFVRTDPRGAVTRVWLDESLPLPARSCLATTLAGLQCGLPGEAGDLPPSWDTREADPRGVFAATYALLGTPTAAALPDGTHTPAMVRLSKSKTEYLELGRKGAGPHGSTGVSIRPDSKTTIVFDLSRMLLVELRTEESLQWLLDGEEFASSETHVQLRLRRLGRLQDAELRRLQVEWARRSATAEGEGFLTLSTTAEAEAARMRERLDGATLEDLVAELQQLDASTRPGDLPKGIFRKLRALVSLEPESCSRLGEVLTTARADAQALSLLTSVLAQVGHSQAQAALAHALRARRDDWQAVVVILPALARVARPTTEAEQAVWKLAGADSDRRTRVAADLALGTMARTLAKQDPSRATAIQDWALRRLESAASEADLSHMADVVGNVGADSALPALRRLLATDSPRVRAAAVYAMRWIQDPAAEQSLVARLRGDRVARVREMAVRALGCRHRSDRIVSQLVGTYAKEPAEEVRLALLRVLWDDYEGHPDVRALMERAAGKDDSEAARKLARRLLGRDEGAATAPGR